MCQKYPSLNDNSIPFADHHKTTKIYLPKLFNVLAFLAIMQFKLFEFFNKSSTLLNCSFNDYSYSLSLIVLDGHEVINKDWQRDFTSLSLNN